MTVIRFDVLEPHNDRFKDNVVKAGGLAKFAEHHGDLFNRIALIRKQRIAGKEAFYQLDMGKANVRKLVLGATDNAHLDQIFEEHAEVRS